MIDTIKITSLSQMGNVIPGSTLTPVVDMAGTPTTKKATIANIANAILTEAGNLYAYAAKANLANIAGQAGTVTNPTQANITTLGSLTNLTVLGNATIDGNLSSLGNLVALGKTALGPISNVKITGGTNGQFLRTDGAGNLSWASSTGQPAGSNTQVQFNDNGAFAGDAGLTFDKNTNNLYVTGNVVTPAIQSTNSSNISITPGTPGPAFIFTTGGALEIPGGHLLQSNEDNAFELRSTTGLVISTDIGNANLHFTFATDGQIYCPANANFQGTRVNVGPGAPALDLESPTLVIGSSSNVFVQASLLNENANGSADWVAYGTGGTDAGGWTDMGFDGYDFNDPNYTLTQPGDGYLFAQGYANGVGGGSLVLATGGQGTTNDIVFATGGFAAENEFARIEDANNVLHLTRAGSGIQFPDGSIQTTAGGGGSTGDLGFTGNAMYSLSGVIVENADLSHGATSALILPINGNSAAPVQLTNTYGNIVLTTGINSGSLKNWTFDNTGNLTLPTNSFAVKYANGTQVPLGGGTPAQIANGISNVNIPTSGGAVEVTAGTQHWAFGTDGTLTAPNDSQIVPAGNNFNIYTNGVNGAVQFFTDVTGNNHTWTFDGYGYTQLPFSQGYSNTAVIATNGAGNIMLQAGAGPTQNFLFGSDGNLTLPTNTSSINYANGQPYGGGGGGGNTANVTFDNFVVQGRVGYGLGLAPTPDDTANLKYLQVRAGDVDSHIHFDTGNNQIYDQYFGDDNKYVKLGAGLAGNITVGTYQDGGIGPINWVFDSNGNLTVPKNGIIKAAGNTVPFNTAITDMTSGSTTVVVTVADNIFSDQYSGQVTISGVNAPLQSNDTWWYLAVDSNKFQLYYDQALTSPVDGTTWPAFGGGGTADSVGSAMAIIASNVTIDTGLGNSWTFDTNGDISFPQGSASFTKGRIQSANGYPTLLGYGSAPEHGGPELDWMNGDNPNDLGNTSVLRNTLYINNNGLYVGMNENHFDVANNFSGSWRFASGGSLTIPAGSANNIVQGQIFSDNESSFINLDVQFDSNVLGGMRLGTSGPKPVDIVTGNGSGGFYTWRFDSQGVMNTPDGTVFGSVEGPGTFGFYNANNTNFLIEGPNNVTWSFDTGTGVLTVPGEGIIQSVNDTVILRSVDANSNIYSARLGTNGGLYFETTAYPTGWLSLTNNSGNANITAATGTSGGAGKHIIINAGDADQSDFYTSAGGNINIKGGLGAFNDGGGGGPGGSINLIAGNSSDPAGVSGNINITSGSNNWIFDYTGNLTFPRDTGANTAPILTISGGDTPTISSTDASLTGPANLLIQTNYLEMSGYTGTKVVVHADDGSMAADANLVLISNNANTGNTHSWTFDTTGNLTVPGSIVYSSNVYTTVGFTLSTLSDIGGQVDYNNRTMGYVADNNGTASLYARDSAGLGNHNAVITANGASGTALIRTSNDALTDYDWTYGSAGTLTLPTISLGSGVDEQAVVSSQRKLIPPFRYSAVIDANNPTVVYTATDVNTTSMKVTMQIQHAGLGMEFFEVFATFTGADTYFTVGNRVSPPTIAPSTIVVGLGVGNAMKITVEINSGATTSWVTYDAVEFGIAVD